MSVARRWIFPLLWLVIAAVVAAALVKIAFFPDGETSGAAGEVPTAELTDPEWVVEAGTVRNDVTLTGMISADAAVPIPATLGGVVTSVLAVPGQWVEAGNALLTIRGEEVRADGTTVPATHTVTAPIAGTLTSFPTLIGATATVGTALGQVAPPTFHASGTIPPADLYRLLEKPDSATVTIAGGPAPFTCTGLTILTPKEGQDSAPDSGAPAPENVSGPTIRCNVPSDITVFAGLAATLVVPGAVAENVPVIPTTAVEGLSGTGLVYLPGADGVPEQREVTLGINDGSMVQVVDGLAVGDTILQFIPGAPAEPTMPGGGVMGMTCETDADGNQVCFE